MEAALLWFGAALVGTLFRQVMRFQEALAELARNMAVAEGSQSRPINYQNSITPPWLVKLWIALAILLAALLLATWFYQGILATMLGGVCFLFGMLASGVGSMILSRPHYLTYYRLAFHTLANREADYRRDGDILRADAARHFQGLMKLIVGDQLGR
ncbi:MAG: hypothetical protein FJX62_05240 [Alphaproteobacteria bacterium]|nr:hypothetical protein [Alphaproteobacteria bacterium]